MENTWHLCGQFHCNHEGKILGGISVDSSIVIMRAKMLGGKAKKNSKLNIKF